MDFEILIIEVEKDLLFGIPETQNIVIEIQRISIGPKS